MKSNVDRVPENLIDYTINTEEDIQKQVQEFIDKFNLQKEVD